MVSVVIPTYQERDTIGTMIREVTAAIGTRRFEIIVVNDNSPDGTADLAAGRAGAFPVKVFRQAGKSGRGTAVHYGFEQATGSIVGILDADLQHPSAIADTLVRAVEQGHDIAIANRYVRGGSVEGWPLSRLLCKAGGHREHAVRYERIQDPTLVSWPTAIIRPCKRCPVG